MEWCSQGSYLELTPSPEEKGRTNEKEGGGFLLLMLRFSLSSGEVPAERTQGRWASIALEWY